MIICIKSQNNEIKYDLHRIYKKMTYILLDILKMQCYHNDKRINYSLF